MSARVHSQVKRRQSLKIARGDPRPERVGRDEVAALRPDGVPVDLKVPVRAGRDAGGDLRVRYRRLVEHDGAEADAGRGSGGGGQDGKLKGEVVHGTGQSLPPNVIPTNDL